MNSGELYTIKRGASLQPDPTQYRAQKITTPAACIKSSFETKRESNGLLASSKTIHKHDQVKCPLQRLAIELGHGYPIGIFNLRPFGDVGLVHRNPQRVFVRGHLQIAVHIRIEHLQHLAAVHQLHIGRNVLALGWVA